MQDISGGTIGLLDIITRVPAEMTGDAEIQRDEGMVTVAYSSHFGMH